MRIYNKKNIIIIRILGTVNKRIRKTVSKRNV